MSRCGYPLVFAPIRKPRVWGSELWTVSDRPGDESVVANGPLQGATLRQLMTDHRRELLGDAEPSAGERFPLLCKVLETHDVLSVQVHPPAERAAVLGGEPKTEMWYVTAARPGAELFVGLKRGVTRAEFERCIEEGSVEAALHRTPVKPGDAMFLPSGRVHAIGAGLTLLEIQQNSDTTYRVFDWNRHGLDGKARELHVDASLASIDFGDVEPGLIEQTGQAAGPFTVRSLVRDPLFTVDVFEGSDGKALQLAGGTMRIVAVVQGELRLAGSGASVDLAAGQFAVIPAAMTAQTMAADARARFLVVECGRS